jgi:hypothetical protein
MSQAMGQPGQGFGTSPLDANRRTPDFFKKFLRKSNMSQESQDEATAFSQLLTQNEIPLPPTGSFSLATLKGQERQLQIENAQEGLAARLESIRARANRLLNPLPAIVLADDVLKELYRVKGDKKPGNRVLFSSETIQDLRPLQLLVALNLLTVSIPSGGRRLHQLLADVDLGTEGVPSPLLHEELKKLVIAMNGGELNVEIPFVSYARQPNNKKLYDILYDKKTRLSPVILKEIEAAHKQYNEWMKVWEELSQPGKTPAVNLSKDGKPLFEDIDKLFVQPNLKEDIFAPAKAPLAIPGSSRAKIEPEVKSVMSGMIDKIVSDSRVPKVTPVVKDKATIDKEVSRAMTGITKYRLKQDYKKMTKAELSALLESQGKPYSGPNKDVLIARLLDE